MSDLQADLSLAREAAEAAALAIRRSFGSIRTMEFKGEVDPVTDVDRTSEQIVVDLLAGRRPDDQVLAEEGGGSRSLEGRHWIIDPLDGTVNFVHGVPHIGVSIGLFENGQPRVAAVVDVMREETFTAAAGHGAHLGATRISVSGRTGLGEALLGTGFPYDRREHAKAYTDAVAGMLELVRGIRRLGTASLDFAWVAAGRLDGFWEYSLAPWDVAAGILLVREAGGTVTDHTGRASLPGDGTIIASNGRIHRELLDRLEPLIPDHVR